MQLDTVAYDRYLDHLTRSGAHAATMAACAFAVLEDPAAHTTDDTDPLDLELITADYWYHVGRRTQAATAVCALLDCDYATALATFAALMPCEDDPADAYLPVDGTEHLVDDTSTEPSA